MKKIILYVLAVIGGAMVGCAAGFCYGIVFGSMINMAFGVDLVDALDSGMITWWIRICSILGAIITPYLLRERINEWSSG